MKYITFFLLFNLINWEFSYSASDCYKNLIEVRGVIEKIEQLKEQKKSLLELKNSMKVNENKLKILAKKAELMEKQEEILMNLDFLIQKCLELP